MTIHEFLKDISYEEAIKYSKGLTIHKLPDSKISFCRVHCVHCPPTRACYFNKYLTPQQQEKLNSLFDINVCIYNLKLFYIPLRDMINCLEEKI